MFNLLHNLLSPDTLAPSVGGAIGNMGKEDTIKFLSDDSTPEEKETIDLHEGDDAEGDEGKEPEKTKEKSKSKIKAVSDSDESDTEDDEDDEEEDSKKRTVEDEIEEENTTPDDEKLELVTPVRRKEILKKYPNLFKDFPYLQTAYYREQRFTEICGTIEDAKEMHSKAETLDAYEADLLKGNTERSLQAMKQHAPKMFNKAVDNYLGTLQKVDNAAYLHVLGNVMKHTVSGMVTEARKQGNKDLEAAAVLLNQYVFGSSQYSGPSNLYDGKEEDGTQETELEKERREFRQEKFNDAKSNVDDRVNRVIKNTIEASVDPRQSMTDYVRRNATRDATEEINKLIAGDKRFALTIDKLWENAFKSNFSKQTTEAIKDAYLAKAKTLLPAVIKKARTEALRGIGKRVRDTEEKEENTRTRDTRRATPQQTGSRSTKSSGIPSGMKTLDFLMEED